MLLPVTTLYGTLTILVTLLLAANISLYRLRHRVWLGVEVPKNLQRMVRAHGNSAEWLAPMVLLLFFLELQHAPAPALHWLGGGAVATRIAHAAFMLTRSRGTVFSATLLYLLAFVMALWALWLRLH